MIRPDSRPAPRSATAKDPVGFAGGSVGHYTYVSDDPVNGIDPSGLKPLSPCLKRVLSKYFPGFLLDIVNIHTDSFVPLDNVAITIGNQIFFAPGQYNPSTSEGVALIAHEIAHVPQELILGPAFIPLYFGPPLVDLALGHPLERAYRRISFEKQAYRIGDYVEADLDEIYGDKPICPSCPGE